MRPLRVVFACGLLVALPGTLRAQIGLMEGLFRNLDNIGGFWTYAGFLPRSTVMTAGDPRSPQRQSGLQGPGLAFAFHLGSAGRERRARRPEAQRGDTAPTWRFELALAYSHITGFRSREPSFDLRGSIRELPR